MGTMTASRLAASTRAGDAPDDPRQPADLVRSHPAHFCDERGFRPGLICSRPSTILTRLSGISVIESSRSGRPPAD